MSIARAAMMIRIICKPGHELEELRSAFDSELKIAMPSLEAEAEEKREWIHFDLTIEPDKFKRIEVLVHAATKGIEICMSWVAAYVDILDRQWASGSSAVEIRCNGNR